MRKKGNFAPKGLFYRFEFGHYKGLSLVDVFTGGKQLTTIAIRYTIEDCLRKTEQSGLLQEFKIITDGRFISVFPLPTYYIEKGESAVDVMARANQEYQKKEEIAFKIINDFFVKRLNNLHDKHPSPGNPPVFSLNDIELENQYNGEIINYKFPSDLSLFITTASPSYINWCLSELEDFFVKPDTLDALESMDVKDFYGLSIVKKSKTVFEIVQYQTVKQYRFSSSAREANISKYKKFDELSENEIENSIDKQIHPEWYIEESRSTYTEQDYIDDAFGGDASAYWNTD